MQVGLIKHLSTFLGFYQLINITKFFLSFRKQKHTLRNPCIQLPAIEKKNICVGIFFLYSGFWIISIFSPFEAPSPSLVTSMNLSSCQFFGQFLFTKNSSLYFFLSLLSSNATCTEFLILYPIIQLELSILLHLSTNLYINKMIVQTLKSKQCFHWSI